jgi:hypothetical protein
MKKILLLTLLLAGTSFEAYSQNISKNALGLRLGDNDGFGGELSFQRKLSSVNRLELDLGWRNGRSVSAVKIAGLYQWVWNIESGFNWYAGVGGGLGSWRYGDNYKKNNPNFKEEKGSYFFGAGDIGIEYNFDIPLLISLDFRPEFYFNGYGDDFGSDIGLGIRYQF